MQDTTKQKLSDLKRATPVLRSRLNSERYHVGDVVFVLRALPGVLESYVLASARQDNASAVVNYLRFGIVDIEGLCDESGLKVDIPFDKVDVCGELYTALGWPILRGLDSETLNDVVTKIVALSERSVADDRAQDFGQADEATLPVAEAAQDAHARAE